VEDLAEVFLGDELFVRVPLWVYLQDKVKTLYHRVEGYELRFVAVSWHHWQPWYFFLKSFAF
jgi:hypothetical protein